MRKSVSRVLAVTGAAALLVGGSVGGATAAHLITSGQIKDHTIKQVDINPNALAAFKAQSGKPGKNGTNGTNGTNGANGKDGLAGAIYRVENYKNGGGGSATVACAANDADSQKYTAISGGVQGSESGTTETQSGFLVSSSFPGRMNWDTGKPKPGRLDGWIVFGNGQHTDTLKVWALCVPNTSIPVQQDDLDN